MTSWNRMEASLLILREAAQANPISLGRPPKRVAIAGRTFSCDSHSSLSQGSPYPGALSVDEPLGSLPWSACQQSEQAGAGSQLAQALASHLASSSGLLGQLQAALRGEEEQPRRLRAPASPATPPNGWTLEEQGHAGQKRKRGDEGAPRQFTQEVATAFQLYTALYVMKRLGQGAGNLPACLPTPILAVLVGHLARTAGLLE